jgi:hypothetical protein
MGFAGGQAASIRWPRPASRGVQQHIGQLHGQVAGRTGVGNHECGPGGTKGTLAKGVLSRKAATPRRTHEETTDSKTFHSFYE